MVFPAVFGGNKDRGHLETRKKLCHYSDTLSERGTRFWRKNFKRKRKKQLLRVWGGKKMIIKGAYRNEEGLFHWRKTYIIFLIISAASMRLTVKVSSSTFYITFMEDTRSAPSRLYYPRLRDGFLLILRVNAKGIWEAINPSISLSFTSPTLLAIRKITDEPRAALFSQEMLYKKSDHHGRGIPCVFTAVASVWEKHWYHLRAFQQIEWRKKKQFYF